jgi:hypothetical protein
MAYQVILLTVTAAARLLTDASQVLSALANFKRTVEDYKRCGPKGSNGAWNFPYLSECVGSPSVRGPCRSSDTPVPCGDGTCRATCVGRAGVDLTLTRRI